MTCIDTCHALFAKHGLDFAAHLESHYRHGFVFSTPSYFVMGRPIMGNPMAPGGAWFISAMAGSASEAWSILPWPLPWIGFERFDNRPRFHRMEHLRRSTAPIHETHLAFTD